MNKKQEKNIDISLNFDETDLISTLLQAMPRYLKDNKDGLNKESQEYYAKLTAGIMIKICNAIDEKGYE